MSAYGAVTAAGRKDAGVASDVITLPDGRRLRWHEFGDLDGSPVIYTAGTPVSGLGGGSYDETARAAGLRWISPDKPGYGGSDYQRKRSLLSWGDDLAVLAGHLVTVTRRSPTRTASRASCRTPPCTSATHQGTMSASTAAARSCPCSPPTRNRAQAGGLQGPDVYEHSDSGHSSLAAAWIPHDQAACAGGQSAATAGSGRPAR